MTEADILSEIFEKLASIYPAAALTAERHPSYGDVVTMTDAEVPFLFYLTPFPRSAPITYRLSVRSPYEHWTGAKWPFNWVKLVRAIDNMLVVAQAREEALKTAKARLAAHAARLPALREKLKRGKLTLKVGSRGEPVFHYHVTCKTLAEATKVWSMLPEKTQRQTRTSVEYDIDGLTEAELEPLFE